ncbi:hypothetical protein B0T13DRAFT_448635 [Neurospora crassa]|nr:hypothetical protein B0T13DRAFT_448635 [Neurospora crassa]
MSFSVGAAERVETATIEAQISVPGTSEYGSRQPTEAEEAEKGPPVVSDPYAREYPSAGAFCDRSRLFEVRDYRCFAGKKTCTWTHQRLSDASPRGRELPNGPAPALVPGLQIRTAPGAPCALRDGNLTGTLYLIPRTLRGLGLEMEVWRALVEIAFAFSRPSGNDRLAQWPSWLALASLYLDDISSFRLLACHVRRCRAFSFQATLIARVFLALLFSSSKGTLSKFDSTLGHNSVLTTEGGSFLLPRHLFNISTQIISKKKVVNSCTTGYSAHLPSSPASVQFPRRCTTWMARRQPVDKTDPHRLPRLKTSNSKSDGARYAEVKRQER